MVNAVGKASTGERLSGFGVFHELLLDDAGDHQDLAGALQDLTELERGRAYRRRFDWYDRGRIWPLVTCVTADPCALGPARTLRLPGLDEDDQVVRVVGAQDERRPTVSPRRARSRPGGTPTGRGADKHARVAFRNDGLKCELPSQPVHVFEKTGRPSRIEKCPFW